MAPPLTPEEERLQKFWHDYYSALKNYYCDLDHIDPYVPLDEGGPPGQTHPGNLAPLCRRHHRAKTHTAWGYARLPDGSYHWTSPLGRRYTVVPAR